MECEVDLAQDGDEAVQMCQETEYDIIFMDIQMPDLDGYEVTTQIRKNESGKPVPIIALTANNSDDDKEKCLKLGMNDYIAKPIKAEDIEMILKKHFPDQAQSA